MALSCRELIEILGEYHSGALDANLTGQVEAHLWECSECTAYLRSYEETIRLSKGAFARRHEAVSQEPPEDLVQTIVRSALRSKHRVPH
jgi:anti-sigma factor RsiW